MARPIELITVLRGEEARLFEEYLNAQSQEFSPEAISLFREARNLQKNNIVSIEHTSFLHGKKSKCFTDVCTGSTSCRITKLR